jgi:hypothetical protein
MSEQRDQWISQIEQLPAQLTELVRPLSPSQLTTPFLANEWSVAQNIHHLADSHMNSYIRCKLIASEDNPTLKPYDQDLWAAFDDAQQADVEISLQLLRSLHARWVHFWRELPEDAWQRTGFHPENGPVSLISLVETYANHGLGHIDQIQRTLAAEPQA